MKKIFFTPGPTELFPEVRKFIDKALEDNVCSINHRSKEFMDVYRAATDSLRLLLNIPSNFNIFYLSSATECMDRLVQNCVEKNSFHFVNGAFADRFYKTAIELNKNAIKAEADYGKSFDFKNIDINNSPELICFTQNETSTGVQIDTEEIYNIKNKFPQSLTGADIVTSAPYVDLDFIKIDFAFFSVQKGFGLPAGLGVLIVNDRCLEKADYLKSKNMIGSYHNFISLYENAVKHQTTETPNMLGIYLLGKVCESMNRYGIDRIRKETEEKAELLYDFFDKQEYLNPFVKNKADRSKTIINIETGGKQNEVKTMLSDKGIIVGSGYGKFKDSQIRIANFPMHRTEDVKKIIEVLSTIKS